MGLAKEKRDDFQIKIQEIKCPVDGCSGKGIKEGLFKKSTLDINIESENPSKFIVKKNKFIINPCTKASCKGEEINKNLYGYLPQYLRKYKKNMKNIKKSISILQNEIANDLYTEKEYTSMIEKYEKMKKIYLKIENILLMLQIKIKKNKKNTINLKDQLTLLNNNYKECDNVIDKVNNYNKIIDLKIKIREKKYDLIEENNYIICDINDDKNNDSDNEDEKVKIEIANPHYVVKKNIYNIPHSFQIIV